MLAVSKHEKKAYYSLGKTGTTTLISALPDEDWYKTGEFSADFMTKIFPIPYIGWKEGYVLQYESLKTLYLNNYEITVLIRDPWERYVSGIKEILQDYTQNIITPADLNDIVTDISRCTKVLDRMFYLSEFRTSNKFEFDKDFPYPSDFALHHNYHIKNWLWQFDELQNIVFLDSKNLTQHISNLGLPITKNQNVSDPRQTECIDKALKNTEIYYYITRYLQSEISRYNNYTR
jgi:hypothetical protein